jgi:signal transduction histidine kinase
VKGVLVYAVIGVLTAALCFCAVKIVLMKRSAREIRSQFAQKLNDDTNTQIDITSADKDIRALADDINKQLSVLRTEYLKNSRGNLELKNAITNISHDLRTPLTAICGYLDMIKKTDDKELIQKYLGIIRERAELMKQLTEELFRYSVILSDDTPKKTEDVCVNRMLEESIAAFFPALSQRGITPTIDITKKRVVRNVDPAALERVFSNILSNAVKYCENDLDITMTEDGRITFSNTTGGLSPVQVQQLFDRFYTVEAARNSTGLGLSIARTLVERMGGQIGAQYTDGRLVITVDL